MQIIIDRFEGDYAVAEISTGETVNIPKILVLNAKEGDVIDININTNETNNRKKQIKELMDKLFED